MGYDFTLHAPFALGESLALPEVQIFYGPDEASMMAWLADSITARDQEPPAWVWKTVWAPGLSWSNEPTWSAQADKWEFPSE